MNTQTGDDWAMFTRITFISLQSRFATKFVSQHNEIVSLHHKVDSVQPTFCIKQLKKFTMNYKRIITS